MIIEIHSHPLLQMKTEEETRSLYIQAFALLAGGNTFSKEQHMYIKELSKELLCSDVLDTLENLCVNLSDFPLEKWTAALDNETLQYSWILDGCMIICQQPEASKYTVETSLLEEAAKSLHIAPCEDFIAQAVNLCLDDNIENLYKNVYAIGFKTIGWKFILEYRKRYLRQRISLIDVFYDICFRLDRITLRMHYFFSDFSDTTRGMKYLCKHLRYVIEDDEEYSKTIREGNTILENFGIDAIHPVNKIHDLDLEKDFSEETDELRLRFLHTLCSYATAPHAISEIIRHICKGIPPMENLEYFIKRIHFDGEEFRESRLKIQELKQKIGI